MTSSKPQKNNANATGRVRSAAIIAEQRRKEKRRRMLVQAGIGAVVVAAVLGTTVAVLGSQDDSDPVAAPPGMTDRGGVVVGSATAPVTVTVVEDFGCPHCKAFEDDAASLLAGYAAGTEVKVEYRGIAFLDRAFSTDYSTRALNASACVAADTDVDTWKKFHDGLFAEQPAEGSAGLDDDRLTAIAADSGADDDAVAGCIADGDYRSWTKSVTDATLGHDGVEGTPTVFVDGELVENPSAASIEAAVTKAQTS